MDKSQLLKGVLESCILKIIDKHETYGYEIVSTLSEYGFEDVKEGTLYPILLRLEKKNLIQGIFKESPLGPKRKYYHLHRSLETGIHQNLLSELERNRTISHKHFSGNVIMNIFQNNYTKLLEENERAETKMSFKNISDIRDAINYFRGQGTSLFELEVIKKDMISLAQEAEIENLSLELKTWNVDSGILRKYGKRKSYF